MSTNTTKTHLSEITEVILFFLSTDSLVVSSDTSPQANWTSAYLRTTELEEMVKSKCLLEV